MIIIGVVTTIQDRTFIPGDEQGSGVEDRAVDTGDNTDNQCGNELLQ